MRRSTVMVYAAGLFLSAAFLLLSPFGPAQHGLRGDYGLARPDGSRTSVASWLDASLFFAAPASFLPPYLEAWDGERLGFPVQYPELDIEWSGVFVTPGGWHAFEGNGNG